MAAFKNSWWRNTDLFKINIYFKTALCITTEWTTYNDVRGHIWPADLEFDICDHTYVSNIHVMLYIVKLKT